MIPPLHQRTASNADCPALIELITNVYQEYGEIMHTAGADSDLLDIEAHYHQRGGEFIVLEDSSGNIVASHATSPIDQEIGLLTFRRLYLHHSLRGNQIGKQLMDWAVDWSRNHGYLHVQFWSDTRFSRAHRFFERFGFTKTGEIRHMDDGAAPYSEFFFCLDL